MFEITIERKLRLRFFVSRKFMRNVTDYLWKTWQPWMAIPGIASRFHPPASACQLLRGGVGILKQ